MIAPQEKESATIAFTRRHSKDEIGLKVIFRCALFFLFVQEHETNKGKKKRRERGKKGSWQLPTGTRKKRKEEKSAQVICCSLIGPNPPGPVPRVHSTTNEPRKRKEKRRKRRRRSFSHPKEYKKEKRIWGNYYRRYYAQFSESNF